MLTKKDLKNIKELILEDIVTFKDEILHEIVNLRDDVTVLTGYRDMIEDYDIRIAKLEKNLITN